MTIDGGAPDVGASGSDAPDERPDPSTPPPSTHTRGRGSTAIVAVIALVALGLAVGGALSRGPVERGPTPTAARSGTAPTTGSSSETHGAPTASGTVPTPGGGYLATRAEVLDHARLARDGVEPYRTAVDDLLRYAHGAVRRDPQPAERLRIRGTEGPFVDDTAAAYGLALAYLVSGDRDFAEASTRYIMAWVDTTTSTRDTCPDDGSCQTSLIISRTVPGFVFAADLLVGPDGLDPAQEERFRAWLRDVMLPTASELGNNWGDAGTFTRVVLNDYLGDQRGFDAAVAKWRALLDDVEADGHIPAEVARGRAGLGYTQEALDYKVATAWIVGRRGVDLWSAVGAKGGSLRLAVDYLARYMHDPDGWPWHDRVQRRGPSPMWELAYARWREADYAPLVMERRPHGDLGHSAIRWTTLTNGVPIG